MAWRDKEERNVREFACWPIREKGGRRLQNAFVEFAVVAECIAESGLMSFQDRGKVGVMGLVRCELAGERARGGGWNASCEWGGVMNNKNMTSSILLRLLAALVGAALVGLTASCGTVHGVGHDVEHAGDAIQDAAR